MIIDTLVFIRHILAYGFTRNEPIPDDSFDHCMSCKAPFTLWNRRQWGLRAAVRRSHCRHCGRLLCGVCCNRRFAKALGYEGVGEERGSDA